MTFIASNAPPSNRLTYALAQKALFADKLRRLDVLNVDLPAPPVRFTVAVHRNHSLEHVTDLAFPWFAFWGSGVAFSYGDYSDALPFTGTAEADLHIVTVNASRYRDKMAPAELAGWLRERVNALSVASGAPVLVLPLAEDDETYAAIGSALDGLVGTRVAPVGEIHGELGDKFYDKRLAAQMGTPLSGRATLPATGYRHCCSQRSKRWRSISTTRCMPGFSARTG